MVGDILDRLPSDRLDKYREFSAVGEWSLAANNIAATLLKNKIPVRPSERDLFRDLLDLLYSFGPPPPELRYIVSRDEVLASLTLTEPDQE